MLLLQIKGFFLLSGHGYSEREIVYEEEYNASVASCGAQMREKL